MIKTQFVQIIKRKIKITNYIVSCLLTLFVFIICSCLGNFSSTDKKVVTSWAITLVILFIVLIVFLVFMSINMLISSLKKTASYIEERGNWRTITIFLGIWQLLFSLFTFSLSIVLAYQITRDILWDINGGIPEIAINIVEMSKKYLNGVENIIQFRILIITISFILLWCFVGFSYEIVKKTFRGNQISVIRQRRY